MSINPERSVAYVLSKPVVNYITRDILTMDQNTLTREAARILRHHERDDIIVINENKSPVGIVTDEDILNKVSDVNVVAETTVLKDLMSAPLITIDESESLQEALHKMRDNRIRKLPVLSKKGIIVGMIYHASIAEAIRDATATPSRLLSPPVKAILGNLGFVLQFAGVLLLVPAIMATILGEAITASGIYLTTVLLLVTGFFLNTYGEKASLDLRQASILVFVSLFILTLFGTIPYLYVFPTHGESPYDVFANGFFSSAAGFTTGGISLFKTPEDLPQSFTFYRSFTQLVGGMSFIYLVMTAFYPENKLSAMRGFITGKTLRMRELFGTITIIFTVYIIIVAILLYVFGEKNLIDNFSLAMSTLATGGFVPNSEILQELVWEEYLILIFAMILGALPFTFHYGFIRKKFLSPKLGKEVLVYFGVLVVGIILFAWLSGLETLDAVFYAVSASSTAGLQGTPLSGLNAYSHVILTILMFIGGCGFSTAGGIKIFRFFQLRDIRKFLQKDSRKKLAISHKKEITSMLIILISFPLIALITAGHLANVTGKSFENSFFEATGIITTGGLSADVINVSTDSATKVILGFLMILGRLEIIAVIYIFIPKLST